MSEDFVKKRRPSDGTTESEEKNAEEIEREEMRKKEEEFQRELKEIERAGKEHRERKKEEIKKFVVVPIQKEEKRIAGELVKTGKIFRIRKKEGIFLHGRSKNFELKAEKKLKRVHGINWKKKMEFTEAMKAYNIKKSKSVMKLDDFKKYTVGLKHRLYKGKGFEDMKKYGGIDPKTLRNLKKKEVDKMRRALTGEKDPFKYQRKIKSDLISPRTRINGRNLPRRGM